MGRLRGVVAAMAVVMTAGVMAGAGAASVGATTFCVPSYFPGCVDNGTNAVIGGATEGEALEAAIAASERTDGKPDWLLLAPGTYTTPDSFVVQDGDPLTIVGSGPEQTFITSSATTDKAIVMDLGGPTKHHVELRDLALVVPESFPDGFTTAGAALHAHEDSFQSVDVILRSANSSAFRSTAGNNTLKQVSILNEAGGPAGTAIYEGTCFTDGDLWLEDVEIIATGQGLRFPCERTHIRANRIKIIDTGTAVSMYNGAKGVFTNLLIVDPKTRAIEFSNDIGSTFASLGIDHATIVDTDGSAQQALYSSTTTDTTATNGARLKITNSIIAGFDEPWRLAAQASPSHGDIDFDLSYSNVTGEGVVSGDVNFTGVANLAVDPGFAGPDNFELAPDSPLLDRGDHVAALPGRDLNRMLRPLDADGDGEAVRDMGAFELVPSCESDPALCPPPTCETEASLCPPEPTCATDPGLCPPPANGDRPGGDKQPGGDKEPGGDGQPSGGEVDPRVVDRKAPVLRKVRFRAPAGRGGVIVLRLSERATVRAVFRPRPRGKRRVVSIKRNLQAGQRRIRLGKARLKPGAYRMRLRAFDRAGNGSRVVVRTVRIPRM